MSLRTDPIVFPRERTSLVELEPDRRNPAARVGGIHTLAVALAAGVGVWLLAEQAVEYSATYDEVAYLRVAAHWWRTGDQEPITRMGSPLLFWKIQQVPVLWALDRLGYRGVVDDPISHQAWLLPRVRLWSLSIWVAALILTAAWSRALYGSWAMVFASWLFALSPNLLAHGTLVTMELPLLLATTVMFCMFWRFLQTGRRRWFWLCAVIGGIALSCKFTTILVPPLLALAWLTDRWRNGTPRIIDLTWKMLGFASVMLVANLLVTGGAVLPLSERHGEHPFIASRLGPVLGHIASRAAEWPIPQDWVGIATQMRHQSTGGPSYLLGQRSLSGWCYYYPVALAVKLPLACWLLLVGRAALGWRLASKSRDWLLPFWIVAFLIITALGSSRNYGVRYLLPLAPLAIVWVSGLAEAGWRWRVMAVLGLIGQALAVASIHPHELSYFNLPAGGPSGGQRILADSNLDWGQGAKALARLQQAHSPFRDLTLYYFGDTDPAHYGVVGRRYVVDASSKHPGLPARLTADTTYLAVSTSLRRGPWGPPGYFDKLRTLRPVAVLDDQTIAIYRTSELNPLTAH